jgi:hypothetical protein
MTIEKIEGKKKLSLPPISEKLPKPREKVLVVLHGNGLVEAYAENNVDIHMIHRLYVENETSISANILDEITELQIPKCYRDLYWPNKCREFDSIRQILPMTQFDTSNDLQMIRELRKINMELKGAR